MEFIAFSLIDSHTLIRFSRSPSISFFVLLAPAVLTIIPISFGIVIWLSIFLIFFLSAGLNIFLDIPPPLGVFGINTIYFPAIDIKVLKAAPLSPLSSFKTCTKITWLGFITSCILYLLVGYFFCGIFSFTVFSLEFFSTGSFNSTTFWSIPFSSSFSLSFINSSLAFSSSSLIFSRSLFGIW